jgi:glycogen synthase
MKILHISPMYAPALGGAESHLKALSENLALRGHEVTVLTANVGFHEDLWRGRFGDLPEHEVISGVQVIRFPPDGGTVGAALEMWREIRGGYRSQKVVFGEDGLGLLTRKPMLAQVIPYLARVHADVVTSVNWFWPPAYYAYLARKLARFTLVGIPLFHTAEAWCRDDVYKRMLAACDAVVVNTPYEGDFVRKWTNAKINVGGVGVHHQVFERRNGAAIRARFGLGSRPVVGFVGRLTTAKGLVNLVQGMRTVWKWNDDVRLVVAGVRSPSDGGVKAMFNSLTRFERERITTIEDFSDADKASIFDSIDVFVLPSEAESFGIAYLEAWMCRKPVIGSRIGPTACVIDDGFDGLLVDHKNPCDIGRTIIELLADPDRRMLMGERGYRKTLEHFTWEKVCDRVEGFFLEVINEAVQPRLWKRRRKAPSCPVKAADLISPDT